MGQPALFARFSELRHRLPWTPLGQWPTPVQPLAGLGHRVGAELWIKRDDLSAPSYGGNKIRKLEHLLAEAVAQQARTVVTVGGIGSNHAVATAIHASHLGLVTRAVVVPQPVTPAVHRNLELARGLGVELVPCSSRPLVPFCMSAARRSADHPYSIGPGGSSPLGTVGYVSAALELQQQIAAGELPEPDEIWLALGSGGTMAGMAMGCSLAGLGCQVVGVRVVERVLCNITLVRMLLHRTWRLLRTSGINEAPQPPRMRVVHGYLGACYGDPTRAAAAAARLVRETDNIELETTYTAKALAALLDSCRARPGRRILFWNTYNSRDTSELAAAGRKRPLPAKIQRWLDAAGDPT